MSTRILDAYLYDKPEEELMKELNSIRDAFHEYLKADIKKDPNKWMRWGTNIVDRGGVASAPGEHSLWRACRYIEGSSPRRMRSSSAFAKMNTGGWILRTANGALRRKKQPTTNAANFGIPHLSTSKHMCLRVWGSRMNFSRMKPFSAWAIFFIWNMNPI